MTDDELRLLSLHEAGHAVVAWRVGFQPGPVTVDLSGASNAGCSWSSDVGHDEDRFRALVAQVQPHTPALLLPSEVLARINKRLAVALAGDESVLTFGGVVGRAPTSIAEGIAESSTSLLRGIEPSRLTLSETRMVAEVSHPESGDALDDEVEAARLVTAACGNDVDSRAALAMWVATETRQILRACGARVHRVADALQIHRTLSGAAVRRLLE